MNVAVCLCKTLMATENCDGITGNLEHVRNMWMCDGAGASKVVIANNKLPYHENVAFKERVDRWFPWTRRELVAALPLGEHTNNFFFAVQLFFACRFANLLQILSRTLIF